MNTRIGEHLRGNVVGYIAIFLFAMSGTALALDGSNTVFSDDITNGEVKSPDVLDDSLGAVDIRPGGIGTSEVGDGSLTATDIADDSVGVDDIGSDAVDSDEIVGGAVDFPEITSGAVGQSELADESVGRPEIIPGAVGSGQLDAIHEHFGPVTDITDTAEHDGAYTLGSAEVSCASGEDLLSVSVDWTASGGHAERNFLGVVSMSLGVTDSATVQVNYDGGPTTARFRPRALCIF